MLKRSIPKDPVVSEVQAMSDAELARWAELGQFGFKQVAAKQELSRREFWRDFWSKGIVAWLALVLSIISLAIALLDSRPSH